MTTEHFPIAPGAKAAAKAAEHATEGATAPAPVGAEASRNGREAAFFDLDKTVIARASMVAFGRPFYHGGLINRRTILRALYGQLVYLHLGASEERLERIRESVLKLTRGWSQARVREIVAEALEQIVEPIIYAEAADLIEEHKSAGRLVVIVSASPEELVAPLGRYLGADRVIASRARLDEDGRYTGSMDFYAYGEFKAEAMRAMAAAEGLDLTRSYAYTDSYTDLPMLEEVGHPVAVNPDRVLARYAREHDFEIAKFNQPVGLWERVRGRFSSVPPKPAIAVSLGALVLSAVAGAFGWWLGSRQAGDLERRRQGREDALRRAAARRAVSYPADALLRRRRGRPELPG